ncbi:MAG: signal peptidase II [Rickettsiales bacterium]
MKNIPALRTMLILVTAIMLADQLVKFAMLEWVDVDARPAITVTSWFKLVMVWNHGISFGMLSAPETYVPYFLMVVALVISAILARLCLHSHRPMEWVGYSLIMGGALGNVIDRIRFGAVADFFYFHMGDLGWPAFNIADAAICIGVTILLFHSLFFNRHAA